MSDRPGDRDQQQAAEVDERSAYRGRVVLRRNIAAALADARAEEAARWRAKIEDYLSDYDGLPDDPPPWVDHIRALLDES